MRPHQGSRYKEQDIPRASSKELVAKLAELIYLSDYSK